MVSVQVAKLTAMPCFSCTLLPSVLRLGLIIFAVMTLTRATALAATLWQWEYSGSGITATGTFTTADQPENNGGYLITGITGARNGTPITGLQAPGTSIPGNQPYTVDDLVFLGPGPQLTSHGFGFSLADGTYTNPFYAGFLPTPGYLEFFSTPPFTGGMPSPGSSELPVQFSATPVSIPEPATWGLILGALIGAGLRRRTLLA